MKEAKVGQKANNSRVCNAVVTLKDVAVNKKQNEVDVVEGKGALALSGFRKRRLYEIPGKKKTLWSGRTNDVKS